LVKCYHGPLLRSSVIGLPSLSDSFRNKEKLATGIIADIHIFAFSLPSPILIAELSIPNI
jgi:hypothetical protein